MTPPIRVRRRTVDPADTSWRACVTRKHPWTWWCMTGECPPEELDFGIEATHAAALDAGLAHLNTHTETR